jgi:hypothetical protein
MRHQQFSLHENAVGQLAEKMAVPSQYLRALAHGNEWQRHLAATVLNEHSSWTERQRVLVRSVGSEVRGVLTEKISQSRLAAQIRKRGRTENPDAQQSG